MSSILQAQCARTSQSKLHAKGLRWTDEMPNYYFSTSGPYLLTSRRHPTGVLVRILDSIPGTDCFRVKLESDIGEPYPRRCYALRSELD